MTTTTPAPAHTPGKLNYDNAHHPEFTLFVYSEADLERDDPSICAITQPEGMDAEEMEANARRLVAAWNACEGISTEALENIKFLDDSSNDIKELRHDKLAEDLRHEAKDDSYSAC